MKYSEENISFNKPARNIGLYSKAFTTNGARIGSKIYCYHEHVLVFVRIAAAAAVVTLRKFADRYIISGRETGRKSPSQDRGKRVARKPWKGETPFKALLDMKSLD